MKILIVPGSARPDSAGRHLIPHVEAELADHAGLEVTVASTKDMTLPFVDTPIVPAFDGYVIAHDAVRSWTSMIEDADAFVFLVPEYNGGMTALQKNAIDWVYRPWNGKRAAIVTYNWYDKKSAVESMHTTLRVVQLTAVEPVVGVKFGEELNPDGTVADEKALRTKLRPAIAALVEAPRRSGQ